MSGYSQDRALDHIDEHLDAFLHKPFGPEELLDTIRRDGLAKGSVFEPARLAGIMAAKRTDELIPLCHPLLITSAEVTFSPHAKRGMIEIESRVKVNGKTGAEMEALTAVSVAALTIYDMCKAVDKGMTIENIRLVSKRGGRSGQYRRAGEKA